MVLNRGSKKLTVPGAYIPVPGAYIPVPGGYIPVLGGYIPDQGGYIPVPGGYIQEKNSVNRGWQVHVDIIILGLVEAVITMGQWVNGCCV